MRFTHSTESDIIRIAICSTTLEMAACGYNLARTIYSTSGTTWAARNNRTGAYVPTDVMSYYCASNNTWYTCCLVADTGTIYGGTTSCSSAEKVDASLWWENLFVYQGQLYAYALVSGIYGQLCMRSVTFNGTSWAAGWVKVQDLTNVTPWRFLTAANGYCYFVSLSDSSLYRLTMRSHVVHEEAPMPFSVEYRLINEANQNVVARKTVSLNLPQDLAAFDVRDILRQKHDEADAWGQFLLSAQKLSGMMGQKFELKLTKPWSGFRTKRKPGAFPFCSPR